MNFKKKVNGSWVDTPNYIHKMDTDTFTTLPADIYANDTTATVGLKGNMSQTGTPTSSDPIQPQECGERTGNLFDMSTVENGKGIAVDGSISNYARRCSTVTPIDVSTHSNVTLSFTATLSRTRVIYALFNDNTLVTRQTAVFSGTTIDVSSGNKLYICFYDTNDTETVQKSDLSNVMLNTGSTPLPYEPYGYKIPISSANTTTPVYLGEVESTRRIRKLVLTGEEDWENSVNPTLFGVIRLLDLEPFIPQVTAYCSHYIYNPIQSGLAANMVNGEFALQKSSNAFNLYIRNTDYTTRSNFKDYLAAQYAAGTPVTVWYVLANEETAVVNEPLMKISTYADEVSNISIPVTAGGDTISVDTTVQPSEVTVNYKGWHPVQSVHERENGAWD